MKQEIWHGDCLELMKDILDGSIDLTVTSPPYDNLRTYNNSLFWSEDIWKNVIKHLYRITKNNGVVIWIVGDATIDGDETGTSFKQALFFKECGFKLHDTMIWDKGCFSAVGALKTKYAPVFEYMFIFVKGSLKTFNPIKDRKTKHGGKKINGTVRNADGSMKPFSKEVVINEYGQRFNIWQQSPHRQRGGHPAPFPEQLIHDHIISWSNERDLILDPFAGSGTTLYVAKNLNRQFIGIEKEKEYYDICLERLK